MVRTTRKLTIPQRQQKEICRLSGISWMRKPFQSKTKIIKTLHVSQLKCKQKKKQRNQNPNISINLYQKLVERHDSDYQLLINHKKCQICRTIKDNELRTAILCNRCDDAYHCDCIQPQVKKTQIQKMPEWFCQPCKQQMDTMKLQKEKQKRADKEKKAASSHLKELSLKKESEGENKEETYIIIQIKDKTKLLLDYISLLQQKIFEKDQNLRLTDLPNQFWTRRQYQCFSLIPYKPQKNPFQYWSSLISALSVTKHTYCSEQVYKGKQLMKMNQSKIHQPRTCEMLHKKDEQSYQKFRQLTEKGKAPALVVQKCQYKGFLIRATDTIACRSIICEYGGEVMNFRDSLSIQGNDSIFRLLDTGDSKTTLEIVPIQYANIAKYFLGINNQSIKNYTRINVQSLMFSYKGRNRIIFYTIKQINKGDLLYIDYNAGTLDSYPTDDFK